MVNAVTDKSYEHMNNQLIKFLNRNYPEK